MSDNPELGNHIRPELRPKRGELAYDIDAALASIVSVRARIPDDAFTASILGTERAGHAVRINDSGLLVTIGYIVAEAEELWIVGTNGQAVPGHVVGYDYETGFGLVQTLAPMDLPWTELDDSDTIACGDDVVIAGYGGLDQAVSARVVDKREFAGYWEYVLDEAIFTAPAHPNWGGAALLTARGKLGGIGSLYVENVAPEVSAGNMIVPVDLLKPIMPEMLAYGMTLKPARPWLGLFVAEAQDNLVIAGVLEGGPAESADVQSGDVVIGVAGARSRGLADFFRRIWACGEAGCDVPLQLYRDGSAIEVHVRSVDRRAQFKSPELH